MITTNELAEIVDIEVKTFSSYRSRGQLVGLPEPDGLIKSKHGRPRAYWREENVADFIELYNKNIDHLVDDVRKLVDAGVSFVKICKLLDIESYQLNKLKRKYNIRTKDTIKRLDRKANKVEIKNKIEGGVTPFEAANLALNLAMR